MRMHKSLSAIKTLFGKKENSQAAVLGFVERIDPVSINGWAIHREGKPLQLTLRVNGAHFPLTVTWLPRADVAGAHGEKFGRAGFRCALSTEVSNALWDAVQKDQPVEVLAENVALGLLHKLNKGARYDVLVEEGKRLFEKKQWADAEALFKQASVLRADDAQVHWMLSQTVEKLGRTWEAVDACARAVALDDSKSSWHYTHATLLERMNRYEQAAEAYRKALKLEPEKFDWHYRLGYVLEKQGEAEQAHMAYLYAIEYDKKGEGKAFGPGIYHAKRGYWPEAATAYAETAKEQPDNAELFYRLGMAHDRCYRWADAAESYARAIAIDSSQPYWFYRLGFVLERQEQWEPAAKAYKNAIERKPDHDPYWYYRLGFVLTQAGRLEEACKAYLNSRKQKALVLPAGKNKGLNFLNDRPEYADYLRDLPVRQDVILYDGTSAGALEGPLFQEFERHRDWSEYQNYIHVWVLAEKARTPDSYKLCSNVLFIPRGSDLHLRYLAMAGQILLPEIMRDADVTNENKSAVAQRWFKIGEYYEQCRRWELAAQAYRTGLQYDTTEATWHWRLANVLEQAGNWVEAAAAYHAAIARKNDHDGYWYYRLGYVLTQAGDLSGACEAYRWTRLFGSPYGIDTGAYTKDKGFQAAAEYTEYYELLDLSERTIVYESYHGASIGCSPYSIFKFVLEHPDFDEWTHAWVVNDKSRIPAEYRNRSNVVFVQKDTSLYMRYLATAKYLINNSTFPPYFIRKPDQVYLNTWHGTPWKTLGKDIKSAFMEHKNTARNLLHATHIISPNRHTTNVLMERNDIASICSGVVAETGYPRIDLTLMADEAGKSALKARLGIAEGEKVVLYAPTFRGSLAGMKLESDRVLADLKSMSETTCRLLFRGHYFVEQELANMSMPVHVVPQEVDTNELLSIVDVLITDYSSIFFDFLVTGRPIIHYAYDLEEYQRDRGLYFDSSDMPGELCLDIVQVKHYLKKILSEAKWNAPERYVKCQKTFCAYEDGGATQRVVDLVFNGVGDSVIETSRNKRSLLFFEGPFMPNGITSSFVNLLNNIDKSRYDVTVVVDPSNIENYPERQDQLSKIVDCAQLVARVGRLNVTAEERWIMDRYDSRHTLTTGDMWGIYQKAYRREFLRMFGRTTHFDVCVNFEGYSKFWASILGLGRPAGVRSVIYQHNDMAGEWRMRFPVLEGLFAIYRYHDEMVSVSKLTSVLNRTSLAANFDIPEEKFVYCTNSIMPSAIINAAADPMGEEHAPLFADNSCVKFITMGRLSPEKDHAKLIRAFARVRKLHNKAFLFILGDGPLMHELSSLIVELALGDAVHLLGMQRNPFPYLQAADCFVLSSNHEGQPMVLLEAQTLGKPIISTDIVGSRSVLEDGYGHLVENNVDGLAGGMCQFMVHGLTQKHFNATSYVHDAMRMFYAKVIEGLDSSGPYNIAHRGGAGLRPENTLAAFEHALALGCDGAELDVQLTKDGQVVVHHNERLNIAYCRKPDGNWITKDEQACIADLSYEELSAYDVGVPNHDTDYASRFPMLQPCPGQRIPLLSEVIKLAKTMSPTFFLVIEIKTPVVEASQKPWKALVDSTLQIIREYGFVERSILCSFDWTALRYAKAQEPNVRTWYTTFPKSWLSDVAIPECDLAPGKKFISSIRDLAGNGSAPWYAGFDPSGHGGSFSNSIAGAGGDGWFAYHGDIDDVQVALARGRNLSLAVWSVNLGERAQFGFLSRIGVDAICADYPDVVAHVISTNDGSHSQE